MAETVLKELTWGTSKVVVEVARRDALGRTIDTTYATKAEVPGSVNWGNLEGKPFNSVGTSNGLQTTGNVLDINQNVIATKSWANTTFATKSDVSTVFDFKGTKDTVQNLPSSGNVTGDVWYVTETQGEYVWVGTKWEPLGPAIDLSGYATVEALNDLEDIVDSKVSSTSSAFTADKIVLGAGGKSIKPSSYSIVSTVSGSTTAIPTDAAVKSKIDTVTTLANNKVGIVGTTELTDGRIILGGGGKDVKLHTAGIVTSVTENNAGLVTSGGVYNALQNYATLTALAGKQNILTSTQLNAVNSGINSVKVTTYDGYASQIAGKQDELNGSQMAAVNSGITSTLVSQFKNKQDKLTEGDGISIGTDAGDRLVIDTVLKAANVTINLQ